MIFNELKKREVPFNILQCYDSLAKLMNVETRKYSIIVLHSELISDLINDKQFYQCDNVYCYDLTSDEIKEFFNMRLQIVFQNQDGTFFGQDLRKLRKK